MFHIALRMATDLGQEQAKTHIYCLLANSAMEQGMVGQAERLFTTVLQRILAEGTKQDSNAVVEISLKLANIFLQNGDVEKAQQGFSFCVSRMARKVKAIDKSAGRVILPAIDTLKEFKNSNACRNSPRPSINFKQLLACSPESPQELMKSLN